MLLKMGLVMILVSLMLASGAAAMVALKTEPPETVAAVPVGSQAVSDNSTGDEQRSSLWR